MKTCRRTAQCTLLRLDNAPRIGRLEEQVASAGVDSLVLMSAADNGRDRPPSTHVAGMRSRLRLETGNALGGDLLLQQGDARRNQRRIAQRPNRIVIDVGRFADHSLQLAARIAKNGRRTCGNVSDGFLHGPAGRLRFAMMPLLTRTREPRSFSESLAVVTGRRRRLVAKSVFLKMKEREPAAMVEAAARDNCAAPAPTVDLESEKSKLERLEKMLQQKQMEKHHQFTLLKQVIQQQKAAAALAAQKAPETPGTGATPVLSGGQWPTRGPAIRDDLTTPPQSQPAPPATYLAPTGNPRRRPDEAPAPPRPGPRPYLMQGTQGGGPPWGAPPGPYRHAHGGKPAYGRWPRDAYGSKRFGGGRPDGPRTHLLPPSQPGRRRPPWRPQPP